MKSEIYKLDEKPVLCPECGEAMEEMLVAKDFVRCANGVPIGLPTKDRCGWCNTIFIATPVEGGIKFEIL